ncbi:hypothetical protein TorRG33x02_207100, partial [Trema orientale]
MVVSSVFVVAAAVVAVVVAVKKNPVAVVVVVVVVQRTSNDLVLADALVEAVVIGGREMMIGNIFSCAEMVLTKK